MVEILEYAQVARDKIEDSYLNGSLDIIRIMVKNKIQHCMITALGNQLESNAIVRALFLMNMGCYDGFYDH